MLFILTGDVQIGKTTWLSHAVDALTAAGVRCDGVLAPGVWEQRANGSFDKLGIDNVLLPEKRRLSFARRADLARAEGTYDENAQAARAALRWHISDEAIRIVNRHFDALLTSQQDSVLVVRADGDDADRADETSCPHGPHETDGAGKSARKANASAPSGASGMPVSARPLHPLRRVLVVDEVGQLELMRNEGLTSAVRLLEAGPRNIYAHACLIARDRFGLVDEAERRFSRAWGGSVRISPDQDAWEQLVAPLL